MDDHVSADLLNALAHPLRLAALVELERHGERSPAELASALGIEREILEEHLATLKAVRLVADDAVPGRVAATSTGWIEIDRHLKGLRP